VKDNYKYFRHDNCEFFPCHDGSESYHNCLFCYCPLYYFNCEGNFTFTVDGIKDCTYCLNPHIEGGWEYIINRIHKINIERR
jgi:Zn-finger protein